MQDTYALYKFQRNQSTVTMSTSGLCMTPCGMGREPIVLQDSNSRPQCESPPASELCMTPADRCRELEQDKQDPTAADAEQAGAAALQGEAQDEGDRNGAGAGRYEPAGG